MWVALTDFMNILCSFRYLTQDQGCATAGQPSWSAVECKITDIFLSFIVHISHVSPFCPWQFSRLSESQLVCVKTLPSVASCDSQTMKRRRHSEGLWSLRWGTEMPKHTSKLSCVTSEDEPPVRHVSVEVSSSWKGKCSVALRSATPGEREGDSASRNHLAALTSSNRGGVKCSTLIVHGGTVDK